MRKRILTVLAAAVFVLGAGIASAQSRGGGGMHGGGMGGGGWSGGSSGWHGGGSWSGGWHGGSWNNGWHGGCWNCGWHGSNVGFYVGFPGSWWWPGFAPGWGWGWNGWGWPVNSVQVVDQGPMVFIQRDQVGDGAYTSAPPANNAPANQYWHYCIDPPGYFPQVQQCNKEWLQVVPNIAPRPAPQPQYQ
jgi:hypothetical protein